MLKLNTVRISIVTLLFLILNFVSAELPSFPSQGASVKTGQILYLEYCADCHGVKANGGSESKLDFTDSNWSHDYSPAKVVNIAIGNTNNHQIVLKDINKTWHIVAYLWTLPITPKLIEEGESEVNHAVSLMKKGGVAFLITKGGEIKELENVNWVMQHKGDDIVKLICDLAPDQYNALNKEHQQALIDYIYASHFELPSDW